VSRVFVEDLASPAKRDTTVNVLGQFDPLIKDALMTILERGDPGCPDRGLTATSKPCRLRCAETPSCFRALKRLSLPKYFGLCRLRNRHSMNAQGRHPV
jgi:hypothetical protein